MGPWSVPTACSPGGSLPSLKTSQIFGAFNLCVVSPRHWALPHASKYYPPQTPVLASCVHILTVGTLILSVVDIEKARPRLSRA